MKIVFSLGFVCLVIIIQRILQKKLIRLRNGKMNFATRRKYENLKVIYNFQIFLFFVSIGTLLVAIASEFLSS